MSVVAESVDAIGTGITAVLRRSSVCAVRELYERTPLPEHAAGREGGGGDRSRRLAALVAVYHQAVATDRGPLVFGWIRPAANRPVTVLTTAAHTGTGIGTAALSFPPGARGRPLTEPDVLALFEPLPCWTRIHAVVDGLLATTPDRPGAEPGPTLADGLLGAWHQSFAWLLVAQPVAPPQITKLARGAAEEERAARARAAAPEHAVHAERMHHRHHELRAAQSTGLWRIHLLTGGVDAPAARAVAGLLCAATDLTGLPYALVPGTTTTDLDNTLDTTACPVADVAESPFLAGSPMLATLTQPPTAEIPGVRVLPRPAFDVTPETGWPDPGVTPEAGVTLGAVLDRDGIPASDLPVPLTSLNRHTFVCGATGAGKSQTVRHLLEQATRAGLPWLVIEPAKAEYRRMAARLPGAEVVVLRPGDKDTPPVGFNPLEPAEGFPLQTHADLTRALFIAAFQTDEPFPQVLAAALTRCYERLGWDLTLGEPAHPGVRPRLPTLADLQATANEVIETIGYGREITDNVRGYVGVRLSSLRLGTTGRFFEGGHRLDFDRLLHANVVLEIEDVGDDRDKAFLIGATMIQLVEHLRMRERTLPPEAGGLRHLTVIEEAHRLLRRTDQPGPAAHAVELFAALLAEVRAYREGLVIAEQIPAKLAPDVIKNTAVKIVHRLPAADDRQTVGATMNLTDDQSRFLVTVPPGTGAFFTDGMDHPILVAVPDGTTVEASTLATRTSSPAALITQPHGTCPAVCKADPCTLRTMTTARRLLHRDPRLVVWAELAVLGHLAGMPAPAPGPNLHADLVALDPRLLDCAIRHAVDAAVTSRSAALAASHSPAEFATHIAAELRAQLAGAPSGRCPDRPRRWLAACFAWNPVLLALKAHCAGNPHPGRHPDSERWTAEYGRPIDGATGHEQENLVRRWCLQLLADQTAVDAVLYGNTTPSALENAVGHRHDTPDWSTALEQALADLTVARRWPAAFLPATTDSIGGTP
ncbi:ATP-binding protein [Dactylosporangium roseum]|uniref:ATP-binding protein n=1 Tax=Dactylosporangium roseum TaxID=47989 RepID=A0ABY5Z858_9ACTN|nr:ATP-binding protein [Dactylosporangium roseum]UWZ36569.1 ATP-binding protein [Dactylosporangium roseum]